MKGGKETAAKGKPAVLIQLITSFVWKTFVFEPPLCTYNFIFYPKQEVMYAIIAYFHMQDLPTLRPSHKLASYARPSHQQAGTAPHGLCDST